MHHMYMYLVVHVFTVAMYDTVPQVVLSLAEGCGHNERSWLDERFIPTWVAAASILALLVDGTNIFCRSPAKNASKANDSAPDGFFARRGGVVIFAFKVVRLAGVLALLTLSGFSSATTDHCDLWLSLGQLAALTYASALAASSVVKTANQALVISRHLTLLTFTIIAVYVYRDIWPLMTSTLQPKDAYEGPLLWVKIALAVFVGAVIPLLEPYPYMSRLSAPNPEQTASLLSFWTYTWLDPIIWRAFRLPHLPAEALPPLCSYDESRKLVQRGSTTLGTFGAGKAQSFFWGLLSVFRKSIVVQSIMLVIFALANISVPVAENRLLYYLETKGEHATAKPWVWILMLCGGPVIESFVSSYYMFLSTGTLVRVEAIVTSLLFEHALCVRPKAGSAKKAVSDKAEAPKPSSLGPTDASVDSMSVTATATARNPASGSSGSASATLDDETTPAPPPEGKAQVDTGSEDAVNADVGLAGRISNLATSDLDNITSGRDFLLMLITAPLIFSFGMAFLYHILGWSSLVGLAIMTLLLPVPMVIASLMQGVQEQKMQATDGRVQSVIEAMSMLRMIKLFGWESRIQENIAKARESELKSIQKRKIFGLLMTTINYCVPLVHMVVTYAVFTVVMKRELSASVVFSSMTAFQIMRGQMLSIIYMIPMMINANVSLGRVADFLYNTDLLDAFAGHSSLGATASNSPAHLDDIGFGHAKFSWASGEENNTLTPDRKTFTLCVDGEVCFKRGAFNLIIGPTGSGKTSVLMALLGEMHYAPTSPDSWVHLPRHGGVAYAAQESWVLNQTIRENILFGAPYDEERYNKVIYQCGLTRDLGLLPAGEATEVGEQGVTLSGGQKARVTLARAVYSSAEILLLDDILAALDVHTARWIVSQCFTGDLLKGRTVLLVTHNVALVGPLAEFVVLLRDGQVIIPGSVREALATTAELEEEFIREEQAIELDSIQEAPAADIVEDTVLDPVEAKGKLVSAEEVAVGHLSWTAFKLFLDGLGGKHPIVFWAQYLVGLCTSELSSVVEMWWLGYWALQYSSRDSSEVRVGFYLGIYCLWVGVSAMTRVYAQLVYTFAGLRASRSIHAKLLQSLLRSTYRRLDVTPASRVTTRCTQDIQAIDDLVPSTLDSVFQVALECIVKVAAVVTFTPLFLLPAVFIAALGGFIGQVYMKAQLSVKREMSTAKAPVLGVFGSAMAGLVSIRAYQSQEMFRNMLYDCIDRYTRAARSFYNISRWVSIRLDLLGQLFTASLAFYLVYGPLSSKPSVVGFLISQAAGFSGLILWFIRLYNDFEVEGNSLERIQQYIDIEHEPEPGPEGVPPAYWPSSGDLRVEKLSARYSPDGPLVLQDVTFQARPGERIGIVGRTGSGKSTLVLALLRCIPADGTITFDGIDTARLNLGALRASVTVIPQSPELLSGTLRHNLDVFGEHDDAALHDALRAAGFYAHAGPAAEGRGHAMALDTEIASGGADLSVGQRQLVALARAIVRRSKLLILDEATSAVDDATDAGVQHALRTALPRDTTVLAVAHRLRTVMDHDRIMVLDAGRIVEYDTPRTLLAREHGALRALVDGSADRDALYAMARGGSRGC